MVKINFNCNSRTWPQFFYSALSAIFVHRKWATDSARFYIKLCTGADAGDCGAIKITGYNVANTDLEKDRVESVLFSNCQK